MITAKEMAQKIKDSHKIVFMTGAGVSTPSGIPDYRSMEGIYTKSGLKEPEYLLSRHAMLRDTADFYAFIKQLYKTGAQPNPIHLKMAELASTKDVTVITQNIDGLHKMADSQLQVVEFHGTLADCRCEACGTLLTSETFLQDYRHEGCGGLIRPNVVLYDEQIAYLDISHALSALRQAQLIVIVGTSFKVYPFAGLIQEANPAAEIYTINKEPVAVTRAAGHYVGDALEVFQAL